MEGGGDTVHFREASASGVELQRPPGFHGEGADFRVYCTAPAGER